MSIIVWGVDHGKCLPMAGEGFRQAFVTSQEADHYIRIQCNKVDRAKLSQYAMYITDEFVGLDRLMHYHNWRDSDAQYRDTDLKVEEVNIEEIKNSIDLAYQLAKRREDEKKMNITSEINNMSGDELRKQAQMFKDTGLL